MKLSTYEDYLAGLCSQHKLIQHSASKPSWLPYATGDNSLVAAGSLRSPYVRHVGFFFNGIDEQQFFYTSVLLFMVVPDAKGDMQSNVAAVRDKAQQIAEQFVCRMRQDIDNDDKCSWALSIQNVQGEAADNIDAKAYGWEVTLTIAANAPEYDAEDWND